MIFIVIGISFVLKMLTSPILISLCFHCSEKKNWSTLQVSFCMANRQIIMLFLYKAQIYLGNTTNIAKGYSWFRLNFWCNFGFYFLIKLCTKNFKGLSDELRQKKAVKRSMWVTEKFDFKRNSVFERNIVFRYRHIIWINQFPSWAAQVNDAVARCTRILPLLDVVIVLVNVAQYVSYLLNCGHVLKFVWNFWCVFFCFGVRTKIYVSLPILWRSFIHQYKS